MAQLTIEGTITIAILTRDVFHNDFDVSIDYGCWGRPVIIRNVKISEAKAFQELLAELDINSVIENEGLR